MEEATGEMVMDFKLTAAGVTVRLAAALMLPVCALIVTVPAAKELATPRPLIDATLVSDELHTTEVVMSVVVPSDR
jgi:hypothetical protein